MPNGVSQLLTERISPLIGAVSNPDQYTAQGGIAAAYCNGEITYVPFGTGIDSSTVFGIGSVTKVFTTSILGQSPDLLPRQISSDLPPGFSLNQLEMQVTYQMLATFTGGVPEATPIIPPKMPPAQQQKIFQGYIASVVPLALNGPVLIPGMDPVLIPATLPVANVYSDCSIGLLGQTLMNSAGYSWDAESANNWYNQYLFSALNMNLTTATPNRGENPIIPTQGYEWTDTNFTPIQYAPWETWGTAGRVYSCASDMMNFLMANVGVTEINGNQVPQSILNGMQVAQTGYVSNSPSDETSQGLAWIIWPPYGSPPHKSYGPVCGKAGGISCVSSYIALCPSEQCGVVVLLNTQGVKVQPVAIAIARELQRMTTSQ